MTDIKELHRKGWALGLRANKLRDYINEHMAPAPEPEPVVEPEPEVKPKATKKKKASKKKASSK